MQAEKELIDLEHHKVRELQARNYLELASQINQNQRKKEAKLAIKNVPYLTSGGPYVSDDVAI